MSEEFRGETIAIDTPALRGSIRLRGARLDDLELHRYQQTVEEGSPDVRLLRPKEGPEGYFIEQRWGPERDFWRSLEWEPALNSNMVLAPGSPVTLVPKRDQDPARLERLEGLDIQRRFEVDDNYMFTVTDRVTNNRDASLTLQHQNEIVREGIPSDLTNWMILHEGAVAVMSGRLYQRKYNKLVSDEDRTPDTVAKTEALSSNGWLGYTDKYWLTALAAPTIAGGSLLNAEGETGLQGQYVVRDEAGTKLFVARTQMSPVRIDRGQTVEVTSRVFAGAMNVSLHNAYKEDLGIQRFELAVDWGNFWFFTKPFFYLLDTFGEWTGSFGLAILMLTIVVKAAFFPIANSSYKAMAKMKKLQPKMTKMRERHKDDPRAMQQAMIEMYRKEKVNPLAGCLPLIPQMFVFYALYKTLFVTIEMRHEPFFGWIQDLSSRDPTNVWNIFGLLPYDPGAIPLVGWLIGGAGFLALGAWPIIMGISMWSLQTLNPPPPDKIQARIFALMPIIFTFFLAPFAAGLVIYWTWNNILSFIQQYIIVRRQGVDTPIGSFLARRYERIKKGEITVDSVRQDIANRGRGAGRRLAAGARAVRKRMSGGGAPDNR